MGRLGTVGRFAVETALEATAFTAYDSARGRNTNFFGNVADSAIGNVIGEGIGRGIGAGLRGVGRAISDTRIGRAAAAAADSNFCRNSFSADTEVSTPSGDVPISEIAADDIVLAYNELTGEIGEYTVTHTISHTDEIIIHLYISGELIETTPEHPFYNDSGEWIDAEDLEVGEEILSLDGDYGIVEKVVVIEDANQPMYNLTVDEAHTFFIGDGDWLVHNCGDGTMLRPGDMPDHLLPEYARGLPSDPKQWTPMDLNMWLTFVRAYDERLARDWRSAMRDSIVDGARIDYGDLDSLGRPTGISAVLVGDLSEGTRASVAVEKWPVGPGMWPSNDHRAHILGKALGGDGGRWDNIFPMSEASNLEMYWDVEFAVRRAVQAGQRVEYNVIPNYAGNSPRPISISFRAVGSGSNPLNIRTVIYNQH